MSKHTPGPWTIRRAHEGYEIESDVGPVTTDAGLALGDARLIAAAPELLEALKACRRQMQNEWHNKPRIGMEAECALADAAIAKAEGKS